MFLSQALGKDSNLYLCLLGDSLSFDIEQQILSVAAVTLDLHESVIFPLGCGVSDNDVRENYFIAQGTW